VRPDSSGLADRDDRRVLTGAVLPDGEGLGADFLAGHEQSEHPFIEGGGLRTAGRAEQHQRGREQQRACGRAMDHVDLRGGFCLP
jgi:hypothetical protein